MRILHTADLHLGHSLNGWDRELEHQLWFDRLADIVEQEEIDLLLIAGDIYDNTNPSGEIQQLFYRGLTKLKGRRPSLRTVISGGNHDPVRRLEAPGVLLSKFDIHVVGGVHRKENPKTGELVFDLDQHLISIPDPLGGIALHVLAVPFLRASDLPGLTFGQSQASGEESPVVAAARRFFADLTDLALSQISQLGAAGGAAAPLIATSHLHCAGGLESEGAERRIMIGGSHAIPPNVFPPELRYVALGHLHRPQTLDGGRLRYSGSCFPLSATEIGYDHGVTIIEIGTNSVEHRHVSVARPAPVLRLPETGSGQKTLLIEDLDAALQALVGDEPLKDSPMGLRPFVYLEMAATDAASVITAEAAAQVKARGLRLAGIRVRREASKEGDQQATRIITNLKDTEPEALFSEAYLNKNGIPPEERHLTAFRDALAEL